MKDKLFRGAALTALSEPIVRLFARGRTDAGLDRQVAAVLALERLMRLPTLDSMEPAAARRFAEDGLSPLDVTPAPMAELIDTTVAGPRGPIPVRIYVPFRAGPHWIVYLHGGGGVIGSVRSSEPVTRLLAAQTGCTVASVDYRLGPEHPHPAAIDDACAAWASLVTRIPRSGKAVVAGDSFGGFLAAHVDRHARAIGTRPPDLQVQIYPVTDWTMSSPTIEQFAEGYLLTRPMLHWFRDHYLGANDREALSPAFWEDLTGSAPALIATAGFDPLVAEGDHYADRLRHAGVEVRHRRYPSLIHGFISLAGGVVAARAAVDEMCGDIMEMIA